MKKRLLSFILTMSMLFSMLQAFSVNVYARPKTDAVVYEANNEYATGEGPSYSGEDFDVETLQITFTVADQGTLAVEGYSFAGWNTQDDGLGAMYQPGQEITITEPLILYAIWKAHIHDNGTAETSDDIKFEKSISSEGDLIELFTSGGSAFLNRDIVLSETAVIAEAKDVSLCLNDHTITLAENVTGSIIQLNLNSTLLITDCGDSIRYFTDEDGDYAFETMHDNGFDVSDKTIGTDYIKTVGGVLYGGNTESAGGAIYTLGYTELILDGINLVGNKAKDSGGAVNALVLTLKDCLVAGNYSDTNGGAIACGQVSITGSSISYNTAKQAGGGLYSIEVSDTTISGTDIIGNRVLNTDETNANAQCGAISFSSKATTLIDCNICDNYVYSKNGEAKFAALEASKLTMQAVTVSNNTAEGKNAFAVIQSGYIDMEGSTVSGNRIIGSDTANTLIYFIKGDSIINDSGIYDNTAVCSGDALAYAGLKTDNIIGATVSFAGNLIISGNTFCDLYDLSSLNLTSLSSIKDTDGNNSKIASYYTAYISYGGKYEASLASSKDCSMFLRAVNPEAYIINKEEAGENKAVMVSRILQQPSKDNDYTFKLYTNDLGSEDISYQWYKLNGSYITQADNIISLTDGSWDGSIVNGMLAGMRIPYIINLTTSESSLYMYTSANNYIGPMIGTQVEAVIGYNGVYKVTPNNNKISLIATGVRFSKNLVTLNVVENNISAALDAPEAAEYRCISKHEGVNLISQDVKVDHVHEWTYSVEDGKTITATCTSIEGTCNYSGTDLSLTIYEPSNLTYDGTENVATFGAVNAILGYAPSIDYEYKKTADGSYATATDFKKAGWYKASFTVASTTAAVEYEVLKKVVNVTASAIKTYVGSNLANLTYTADTLLGTDTYTGTLSTNADKDTVGTYDITQGTLSAGSNYEINFTKGTYTVAAKPQPQDNPIEYNEPEEEKEPSLTVPVSGDKDTVKLEATVNDNNATIKNITSEEITNIGTGSTVIVDLSSLEKDVTGITIPKETFENVANSEAEGLEIKMPNGTVAVFDKKVLAAVADQAKGNNIKLVIDRDTKAEQSMTSAQKETVSEMNNPVVLDAYFISNGTRISDFRGGEAEVTAAYPTEYPVRVWYVTDEGEKELVPSTYDGKVATFTVTHFSHYVVEQLDGSSFKTCPQDETCVYAPFTDTDTKAWYHDGVHFCVDNKYMNGYGNNIFKPYDTLSRAMVVQILYNLEGRPALDSKPSFTDVDEKSWYADAIAWAEINNVVNGYGNGKYGPEDPVSREQLAAIYNRYASYKGYKLSANAELTAFTDAEKVSGWALKNIKWAIAVKLMEGKGNGILDPKGNATRAEAATMLKNFCENIAK